MDHLTVPWYAVVNDLIGGWAVATVDKPSSQINWRENPAEFEVADFMEESTARHIVELHNASLSRGEETAI